MTRDRWHSAERLYHAAREMDPAGRARYLAEACAGDESLLREVESLLAEDSRVSGFMEGRAVEGLAHELASEPPDSGIRGQDLTGRMLSHYLVLGRIASGGMGVVYQARDTRLERTVAIKVLPPALIQDADRRRRFIREAKAASALNHPNIITIHEITQAEGVDCIVMELVAGKPLDRLVEGKGLRLREALGYGIQIADALAASHAAGIVHRDLKPANLQRSHGEGISAQESPPVQLRLHLAEPVSPGRPRKAV